MGFIIIYNDPLNSKVLVFRACYEYMKTIHEKRPQPPPLPMGGIFLDNNL